jgi:hypothetical protein
LVYIGVLLAFLQILVRPGSDDTEEVGGASWVTMAVLFLVFGTLSILFWAYFALRPRQPAES